MNWPPTHLRSVAIVGADEAGARIAMSFLDAGIPVTLVAHGRGALEGGVALIRRTYESQVRQRTLAEYKYAVRMAFLSTTTNDADIASADVVIESCAGGRGTSSDA